MSRGEFGLGHEQEYPIAGCVPNCWVRSTEASDGAWLVEGKTFKAELYLAVMVNRTNRRLDTSSMQRSPSLFLNDRLLLAVLGHF
jgi:hypothetical protein